MASSDKQIEKGILQLIRSEHYRPIKPRAIAKKLGLLEDERGVKKAIKKLVKQGEACWGPKHLVMKTDRRQRRDEVVGVFRRAAAGYGFVTPDSSTATDRSDDIYIPKQKTHDAADGDTVKIRVSRRRQGAELRVSGRVIDVIDRRTHQFVGTYYENGGYGFVASYRGEFLTKGSWLVTREPNVAGLAM